MKRQVLIVDDNPDDRVMMTQVVEMMFKQQATVAPDGYQAIRLARETAFDVVLLDLKLPGLQGPEVAKALRQMEGYRAVPIIAITAHDLAQARWESLQAGCTVYLTKPVNLDALVDVLSTYLPRPPGSG